MTFFVNIGKHLSEFKYTSKSAAEHVRKNTSNFVIFKTNGHEVNKIRLRKNQKIQLVVMVYQQS